MPQYPQPNSFQRTDKKKKKSIPKNHQEIYFTYHFKINRFLQIIMPMILPAKLEDINNKFFNQLFSISSDIQTHLYK